MACARTREREREREGEREGERERERERFEPETSRLYGSVSDAAPNLLIFMSNTYNFDHLEVLSISWIFGNSHC